MNAMILAAGLGVRLRPLTLTTPKPLLRINDRSLIEYQLTTLAQVGVVTVVINVIDRFLPVFRQQLGDGRRYGLRIDYANEGDMPLGTGMGIYRVLDRLGSEPFLLLSGDIWTHFNMQTLMRLPAGRDAHLLLVNNPAFHAEGDFILMADGRVQWASTLTQTLNVNPRSTMRSVTYGCLACLNPLLFDRYPTVVARSHFSLADLLTAAITDQRVEGQLYEGPWFNVGTTDELSALRQFCGDSNND